MIKKFFSALALVLFATSMMAQSGLTCEDPIPVDKNYKGKVEGPCEVWYTANTYDLPLHVYFSPDSANSEWSPEVYVDFTCEPGVYDDPKLSNLLLDMAVFGVELPIEFLCDGVYRNGKQEWDLSVSKSYREQLAESGITYNVKALVRVVYFEGGSISLTPDTTFSSCMNNEAIQLGDTIDIYPNDSNRVFVMPFADWQNDSIQFTWVGEQEADVWLAVQDCGFTPDHLSSFVWDKYHIAADFSHKLQQQQIDEIIKEHKNGGVYFGKVLSPVGGKLVVEKIPMASIKGGATLLEYGKTVEVSAEDPNQLFCFPRTWKATQFLSSANSPVTMFLAASPDFSPSISDINLLAYHTFSIDGSQYWNYISTKEMNQFFSSITEDYVYVRFQCATATTITPDTWDASSCTNSSLMIRPNQSYAIPAKSRSTVYRMLYDDWKDCEVVISWNGSSKLPIYIADTCSSKLSSTSSKILKYSNIKSDGQLTLSAATINSWASRVDGDGYIYVTFNPTNNGDVTFMANKMTPDTIYTTISETLCYGESYEWNGQSYSTAGEYKQSFTAANGADSIVTLQLTILPEVAPTKEEATIEAGETYTWNGKEYTEAGEYTITLQDKNGCDYQATLVLKVNKPLSPCLQSSIKLNVGDEVVINLDSAFTVYAIDYAAWMAQPVTLVWTGAEALHTFVAETCVFALAPYNKYVHAYVPVPAQGDSALDMEALAPYVDEDGYLYVRFLTEFEGVLTVDN